MIYYEVAPLKIVRAGQRFLTYTSDQPLPAGSIVRVSIGRSHGLAIVWKKVSQPDYACKPIEALIEPTPLPKALLKTAEWIADYYSTPLPTVLQTLLPAGLEKRRRAANITATTPVRKRTNFVLNDDQQAALTAIETAGNRTVLLHGVTGSGKTAVYIALAARLLAAGQSVIVLTPEISLTPQLVAEFTSHFPRVIVTHSQMKEADRHRSWQQALAASAEAPVVIIGPRSALFMPLAQLGAIIIDECHEPSYKQEQQPRYMTSRAAKVLAAQAGARLVLGSATPSVSDYYLAERSGIIARLGQRAKTAHQPRVSVIDATKRPHFSRNSVLSTPLITAIQAALDQQRQVLLFHNRRGTAGSALCQRCGWHADCPDCHLPLTLHADTGRLLCHLCGRSQPIPPHCPVCKSAEVIFKGIGTKRIETEALKLFPRSRIARFDADNARGEQLHEQYQTLYDGDIDIIIGTQLLAKGLDLPNLGLVGIIQADAGLLMPDYGARERSFQLIAQASGRVGRQDHETAVIIQTYSPTEPAITSATTEDYAGFYAAEIARRRQQHFPPFSYLLKAVVSYKTEAAAVRNARLLASRLRREYPDVSVVGPTPAFYERLRGLYRWQVTIRSQRREVLQAIALTIPPPWQTELDPINLLS